MFYYYHSISYLPPSNTPQTTMPIWFGKNKVELSISINILHIYVHSYWFNKEQDSSKILSPNYINKQYDKYTEAAYHHLSLHLSYNTNIVLLSSISYILKNDTLITTNINRVLLQATLDIEIEAYLIEKHNWSTLTFNIIVWTQLELLWNAALVSNKKLFIRCPMNYGQLISWSLITKIGITVAALAANAYTKIGNIYSPAFLTTLSSFNNNKILKPCQYL